MFESCERYWRRLATGLSFLCFGLGGLLLRIAVFPALNLLIRQQAHRKLVARRLIRLAFLGFIKLMQTLGVLRYELLGLEKLERGGLLILANHPTLIDTVFLMALVKNADCIVKSSLWNNPFTRGPVSAAGYIKNDEQGMDLLTSCIASLQEGNNLIIFPERTRTPRDGSMRLKRGAANIAVRGHYNVTPVRIHCEPMTLGKGEKWWHVPARRAQFLFEVGDDIQINCFIGNGENESLSARHLTNYLQHYFTEEKNRHA